MTQHIARVATEKQWAAAAWAGHDRNLGAPGASIQRLHPEGTLRDLLTARVGLTPCSQGVCPCAAPPLR